MTLIFGELTGSAPVLPLDCPVPGVVARQCRRRHRAITIQQRLYECPNGLALGARRGGPLHAADERTWEIFLFDRGVPYGESVGMVDEATLERAVRRLAAWGGAR